MNNILSRWPNKKEFVSIEDVEQRLENTDVEVEFKKRKRALLPSYEVHVALPKFKIESSHDLPEVLRDLGMEKMFDRQRADFTDMVHPSRVQGVLHVDSVSHNFFVELQFFAQGMIIIEFKPR